MVIVIDYREQGARHSLPAVAGRARPTAKRSLARPQDYWPRTTGRPAWSAAVSVIC